MSRILDDHRKVVTLSTFGFLSGGTLTVNVTNFSVKTDHALNLANYNTVFGFSLDKSTSFGISSYMDNVRSSCIFTNPKVNNSTVDLIVLAFDFKTNRIKIQHYGEVMRGLTVSNESREEFLVKHNLNRRSTGRGRLSTSLSDGYLFASRRAVRQVENATFHQLTGSHGENRQSRENHGANVQSKERQSEEHQVVNHQTFDSHAANNQGTNKTLPALKHMDMISLNNEDDGNVMKSYFLVYIEMPQQEGLYNLLFHNCLPYSVSSPVSFDLSVTINEDNNGNFLSAGEMPVPTLFFVFSVIFLVAGLVWFSYLRMSEGVYKLHYLMLAVVLVKSLSCMFHGVNMYFIEKTGIHEDAWAVLWYIVYLTRGALMFVTVLLIGSGWAFINHVLSDKEKKLFLIVIPLQILDRVAEVIVAESEIGDKSYMTWKEIFILIDLLCCGAILFPVVWSIRHLQEASNTDGKAALNCQKLKLFRHFYVLVVCYIYFSRLIVYVMKITLPFQLEWLTHMFAELAMLVFFYVTASTFRPASDNPYLQVPHDSDEEDMEMEEVLTKTGNTESVVKVNQKTDKTNQHLVKQRESSHEYD